jgi:hypothetical protein
MTADMTGQAVRQLCKGPPHIGEYAADSALIFMIRM